ncbi:MAG: flagellar assembly protein T N-terminal domain-containing protein [candidate division WOR-3 bacterium]
MRFHSLRLAILGACLGAACVYYSTPPATSGSLPAAPVATGDTTEGTEVLTEGVAAITAGIDIARDQALRDALRKAVEQGVGTYINSETRVQNFQFLFDRIYSQASGYVSSYRVIGETREADLYRVIVRARVKLDKIEDDLRAIGILVQEQGRPRLLVVIKPAGAATMEREMTETRIVAGLQARGFPVVDETAMRQILSQEQLHRIIAGDNQTAMHAGLSAGAEIVIAGTMQQQSERRRVPYSKDETEFHRVQISARAVNAQSAEVLAATAVTREVPFSLTEAANAAADSAVADLTAGILRTWRRRLNLTQVHAANATYEKVERFKAAALAGLRGVTAVITRELVGSEATIEIVSETTTQELLDMLRTRMSGVAFTVTGVAGTRIDIRFED